MVNNNNPNKHLVSQPYSLSLLQRAVLLLSTQYESCIIILLPVYLDRYGKIISIPSYSNFRVTR